MSIVPLGLSASFHSLVQGAETLLSQAEDGCRTIRDNQKSDHVCTALVQLDQALFDGKDYIQREYDHISNTYSSSTASQADQTAKVHFWVICTRIEDRITKPLEGLVQNLQYHQRHHNSHSDIHHHCYFCRVYYHHHHHSHSGVHFLPVGYMVRSEPHHHGHDHHHVSDWETQFQEMVTEWRSIKGSVASCFDDLQTRLEGKKDECNCKRKDECNCESNSEHEVKERDNKGKTIADAAQKMIEGINVVGEEMRQISNVEERIQSMAGICPVPRGRSHSSSSSSTTSFMLSRSHHA